MKINALMIFALIAGLSFSAISCSSDSDGGKEPQSAVSEITVTGLSELQWTYISLEDNKVVGSSPANDADADAVWAGRTDWDIAVCGDKLRTNSGSSGKGLGGLRRIDGKDYDEVSAADVTSLDQDTPQSPDSQRL